MSKESKSSAPSIPVALLDLYNGDIDNPSFCLFWRNKKDLEKSYWSKKKSFLSKTIVMIIIQNFDFRSSMMDGSGSLEEQLAAVGLKAHEVASKSSTLKQIEELGAILEGHLILDNR